MCHGVREFVFAVGLVFFLNRLAGAETLVIYAASNNGVFKSSDGAGSWTIANSGLSGINVFSLAIDPSNPATVYAGTLGRGVFKSTNGGQTWSTANSGFTDTIVLSLAIDPVHPNTIYAGTATSAFFPGSDVFKSTDGGQNWIVANSGLPVAIIGVLRIDPSNPAIIYAGTNGAGVFKSVNAGQSWTAANAGMTPAEIEDLAVDLVNPTTLYAGLGGCSFNCLFPAGVLKSTNGGMSWTAINSGLTDLQVVSLAMEPANTNILYAGTRLQGIFKSNNGGASWSPVNPALQGTLFAIPHLPLVTDPLSSGTVYAGTVNGVFKSTDGGMSWTSANTGFPASTSIFAFAGSLGACGGPTISGVSVSPNTLWPPNHKMVPVVVNYTVNDDCDPAPVCSLSVRDNEAEGVGDGHASPDWIVVDAHDVDLRAERLGTGSGRVYTIAISCQNKLGLSSDATATVTVAHDQDKKH